MTHGDGSQTIRDSVRCPKALSALKQLCQGCGCNQHTANHLRSCATKQSRSNMTLMGACPTGCCCCLLLLHGDAVDTTPPAISTFNATTITATAVDLVDGPVPVQCSAVSGGTPATGFTTVNCTAMDAAGNRATRSFTVSSAAGCCLQPCATWTVQVQPECLKGCPTVGSDPTFVVK